MFEKIKRNAQIAYSLIQQAALTGTDSAQLFNLASGMHLARTVAYELNKVSVPNHFSMEEDDLLDVLDEDGQIREYYYRALEVPINGLVCFVLIGRDTIQNNRIHLTFRGTKDLPSLYRDFEYRAPGHESFYKFKDLILTNLCNIISEYYGEDRCLKLVVSGHSLGAADAANTCASVLQAMAQLYINNPSFLQYAALRNLSAIILNAVNPAGISSVKAFEAKMDAIYLATEHFVALNALYVLAAGDAVSQSGQAHLFATCASSVARVTLVNTSIYEGWFTNTNMAKSALAALPFSITLSATLMAIATYFTYTSHKLKFSLENQLRDDTLEVFTNSTPEGQEQITRLLSEHFLDYSGYASGGLNRVPTMLFGYDISRTPSPPTDNNYVWVYAEDTEVNLVDSEDGLVILTPAKLKVL